MAEINKKELEHLADLARLELNPKEEEKFLKDLSGILNYFQELNEVNTDNVPPMNGGTESKNIFREDGDSVSPSFRDPKNIIEAFPEKHSRHLKVPSVFE